MTAMPVRPHMAILMAACLLVAAGCADRTPMPVPTAAQPCPPWTEFPGDRHSNRASPYLGCASETNLRSMLENPADLQRGRPLGPADGERAARAIAAYRQGTARPAAGAAAAPVAAPAAGAASGP